MLEFAVVTGVAFGAALLTLFSGFGLGTLLLPVFALFFPVEAAVAATALVHLANNVFKLGLVGHDADPDVVLRFGGPATLAALGGAWVLASMAHAPPAATWTLGGVDAEITWTRLVIGPAIVVFALFDLVPALSAMTVDRRWLSLGGLLSGFFGGLSGHQGALRSTFLVKCGLSRDAFIGTGVVVAVLVDCARLAVYGISLLDAHVTQVGAATTNLAPLLVSATLASFVGSFVGARLLEKVTLVGVQRLVGAMILLVGVGITAGWI